MKHKIYIFTLAAALLTGCANDDFVGQGGDGDVAINFGIVTGGATRAEKTGADAAADLGGSFVVYGEKSGDGGTHIVVFDHYNVTFVDGTANSTVSNYKGWEYVGVTPVSNTGTTTIEDFTPVANQTIKYWDKTQVEYDFFAFSKSTGNATFSKVNTTYLAKSDHPVYTISGTIDDLAKAYVADVVVVKDKDKFSREHPVTPKFRSVAAKLRIGIYETIPGYSVKDIKFYVDDASATTTPIADACLFATSEVFPTTGEGIVNVYFPDAGYHAKTEFVSSNPDANSRTLKFSQMVLGAEKESYENAEGPFIGRTSATATYTNADKSAAFKNVCAIGSGHALSIKVDYTLVPTDGQAGGEITIKGTMATVPAIYTDWQPNYAYTYIFKISDDSGDGLYPITFDAAEIVDGGPHETDTESAKTSITTYQKGVNITANNEYLPEQSIYVTVGNYNTFTLADADYWKEGYIHLFKATVEDGAVQGIDELSVSNCFTYGTYDATEGTYTVTDVNGKKLVLTDVTVPSLEILDAIPAEDGPNGQSVSAASAIARIIDPDPSTVYVFQYLHWPVTPTEVPTTAFNTLPKDVVYYGMTTTDGSALIVKKISDGTLTKPEFGSYMKNYNFQTTLVTGPLTAGTNYYKVTTEKHVEDGNIYDAVRVDFIMADGTEINDGTTYYNYVDNGYSLSMIVKAWVNPNPYADTEYNTLPTGQVVYWFDSASHANRKLIADGTETSASFTGKVMTTQPEFAYKVIRVK